MNIELQQQHGMDGIHRANGVMYGGIDSWNKRKMGVSVRVCVVVCVSVCVCKLSVM